MFSTIEHPQKDGQTKVVNRTHITLLRAIIQKNLRYWGKCFPHIEFSYNRIIHATSLFSSFEVMYSFNPLKPMDILPFSTNELANLDGKENVEFIKELHVRGQANIERKNEQYAKQSKKGRFKVFYQPGDWIWVQMRKERFSTKRK